MTRPSSLHNTLRVLALSFALTHTGAHGSQEDAIAQYSSSASSQDSGQPGRVHHRNAWSPSRFGERLFFDTALSANGQVACASCHRPDFAFADNKPVSLGVGNQPGTRNTPSLFDVAQQSSHFWDGRETSLESVVLRPFLNPVEHALPSTAALLDLIARNPLYASACREIWDVPTSGLNASHIATALTAYIRTLQRPEAPFDRQRRNPNQHLLTPSALRGWALFTGRAACARCHPVGNTDASFTDRGYHTTPQGLWRIADRLPELVSRAMAIPRAALDQSVARDVALAELGRFLVTLDPGDIGKFRTPSLRDVARTAPYMHDGSVPTLAGALEQELYYRTLAINQPIVLSVEDKTDLLAFLHALSSDVEAAAPPPGATRSRLSY